MPRDKTRDPAPPRRSLRLRSANMSKEDEDETAKKTSVKNVAKPTSATSKAAGKAAKAKAEETVSEEKSSPGVKTEKETKKRPAEESEEPAPAPKAKRSRCKKAMAAAKAASVAETKEQPSEDKKADISTIIRPSSSSDSTESGERNYWLMKAEPETRLENGVDVKFSIDDLAARTEPEPWDGIRNYAARNNLRAMKKGDLAFFYHSNCKEPGIVGTMEIVQEHSPDLSAHDPKAPYYDPSSDPANPKWSVVHVKFRSKFSVPIGLKELRDLGKPGGPLEHMQLLRQGRLSVSKVSKAEWDFLMNLAEEKAKAVAK
ncbi:uncharacterized protein CTHT_0020080 [Thermochaetoides thermophila DSM 1495]|uniref:Thymocyte nuclear protein 1 n=1 Tax=Chaetomium thermophilum (strain DSM 1495 / CBS 144.50 / IMI 039719) TaxID=759272 RepID=G0S386_CHATD|nr:hypothetical protein CTHT_0020080 [Thermochaetoides thermophila DSM 1495]EGS22469.1 hypothetical protein CTHT_0020080 [Thermochaetoides thermophila DSM 1495]